MCLMMFDDDDRLSSLIINITGCELSNSNIVMDVGTRFYDPYY